MAETSSMFPKAEAILKQVAEKYGITVEAMRSPRRFKTLVRARREFIQLCCNDLEMSTGEIGEMLGRHHATILNQARKGEPHA